VSRIEVDYRLAGADLTEAALLAKRIAYEQTVELPEAVVTDAFVNEYVVGRVERIERVQSGGGSVIATISYNSELANGHLLALLNLLFGNVSMYPGVRLSALRLPPAVLSSFAGPRFGIDGIRHLVGVYDRPLLASALKPRGLAPEALAALAGKFALGGGDIVKDDQNLVDDFESFKQRVALCASAVARANDRTGRQCLYFPHVSAPVGQIERFLDYVCALGLHGVLMCPMVVGLETAGALAGNYPLALMAHPALTGSYVIGAEHGIAHDVLLGTLFRLAGADISIFPSFGGRFSFPKSACMDIEARLGEPLGTLAPAWACPAGGMQFDDMPALARTYGRDSVFLIGGALYAHGEQLDESTRAFRTQIESVHIGQQVTPGEQWPCTSDAPWTTGSSVLAFENEFQWSERESSLYKSRTDPLSGGSFEGVRRVELIGKFGERTGSDLRYFEVAPGGFSSHEKHVHSHIVIGARGHGTLLLGNRQEVLQVNDVAYIAPLQEHQFRNDGPEPFGFFCIVDHDRDRPMSV
jgi:ribulose-bisphosphate carboxylase large chain